MRRSLAMVLGLTVAASVAVVPSAASAGTTPQPVARAAVAPAVADAEQRYVQSVYQHLFGRDPDPRGLASWTTALRRGTPRVAVAHAITSSDEFRKGLITDAYEYYLDRAPDPAGMQHWLTQMHRGLTIAQLEAGFLASEEYYHAAGADTWYWVRALYLDVLGRTPAEAEVSHWFRHLTKRRVQPGSGSSPRVVIPPPTRHDVSMGFLLSSEHLSTVVDGYYQHLLDRRLDPSGLRTWVGHLQSGGRDEEIVGGIIASAEYWTNLGR